MVYFDDILISNANLDVHLQHLRRFKFFAVIAECSFRMDSVLFLGYMVSNNGLSVDEPKVAMVNSYYIA